MNTSNINTEIARVVDCAEISDEFIRRVVELTIAKSGLRCTDGVDIALSVAIVGDGEIAQLNQTYRGVDKSTDVLSFPEEFTVASPNRLEELAQIVIDGDIELGELVLGCEYITKCATIDAVPTTQEFAFVIAHGALHLLGYDHGETMFAIGQDITNIMHEKKQR